MVYPSRTRRKAQRNDQTVYYVTACFIEGQEEETLKPGPELEESITGIRNYILERQKFYYG